MADPTTDQQQQPGVPTGGLQQMISPQTAIGLGPAPQVTTPPAQMGTSDQNQQLMQQLIEQSKMGMGMASGQYGRMQQLQGQADTERQQLQQLSQPQNQPRYGFGHPGSTHGVLANIGLAIADVIGATRFGQGLQQVMYGPGIRQYETERGGLAKSIEQIQQQESEARETMGTGASMGYKPITAGAQMSRAESYAQNVKLHADQIQQTGSWHNAFLQFQQEKLSVEEQRNMIMQTLGAMNVGVQEQRNQILFSLGGQRITMDASEFNAAVQNNNEGFFDQLLISLGMRAPAQITPPTPGGGVTPAPYQTTPTVPQQEQGKGKGGGGKGGTTRYKVGNQFFNIPPDQVKEFLKDNPGAQLAPAATK